MTNGNYKHTMNRQQLYDHMIEEHGLILLDKELQEIEYIVLSENKKLNRTGWFGLGFSISAIIFVVLSEIFL